jgi:small-conductance mechanosensitive channel
MPAADFDPAVTEAVRRTLRIGFIILLGWGALAAIGTAADTMAARYRIDVEDNLAARRMRTQLAVLRRLAVLTVVIVTTASVLLSFPAVQAYGVSLFASAGLASLIVGFAARPILANVFAGIQIALTQPIRIDDVVIVEGEWGWVEEINATYVVVRLWDWRRMVLPLTYFMQTPFQNWTRESASLIGTAMIHVDYAAPVEAMRAKLEEIVRASPLWDGKVVSLQVTELRERTMEVRCLASARNASQAFDLRCLIREEMVGFLKAEHPSALPRDRIDLRADLDGADRPSPT